MTTRPWARHVVLCLVGALMMYPLLWLLSSSVKPGATVFTQPGLWPESWDLTNYPAGWVALEHPFSLYLANSLVIVVLSIVGN